MPIFEYACPRCRRIFSFLSKRLKPDRVPACPKCGCRDLRRLMSAFSALHGAKEPAVASGAGGAEDGPDLDNPRVLQAMQEIERDLGRLDEKNPRHMAHMMRKMKDVLPPDAVPKEVDVAIRRLEAGEDPEKVEADLGGAFGDLLGGPDEEAAGGVGGTSGYARDGGLYDY
jgi:putative FmdB family regulatory protein